MWNKLFIQRIAAAGTAALLCPSVYAAEFNDTDGHWAKDYISFLSDRGIVSGMGDGSFLPDESVSTEQFTAMVLRSCKGEIVSDTDDWADGYMDYALENGIIEDYDMLNRKMPIERRSAARIVHETLIKEYGEEDEIGMSDAEGLADLYDCHSCAGHIIQVYLKGIMTGRSETFFDNYGILTRAEAAAIITRMLDKDKRIAVEHAKGSGYVEIQPELAFDMMKNGAVLIDTRGADAYSAGHIDGSINIPLAELNKNPYAAGRDKNTALILYCAKGRTSSAAAELLKKAGYNEVYTIPGTEQYNYILMKSS